MSIIKKEFFSSQNKKLFELSFIYEEGDLEYFNPISILFHDCIHNEKIVFDNEFIIYSINIVFNENENYASLTLNDFEIINKYFHYYFSLVSVNSDLKDCDCCGGYESYSATIHSRLFKKEYSFTWDDHLNSLIFSGKDLMDFILTGNIDLNKH